jgi:competence protein ComEA
MIVSLLIKLGMLCATMAVVFWVGWQSPGLSPVKDAAPGAAPDAGLSSAVVPGTAEQSPADRSAQVRVTAKTSLATNADRSDAPRHGPLDLNLAGAEDLESLPGIGAVLAQRVIAYRRSVGRFQTVDQLREVKGIGSKKFERVKPLVTVAASGSKGKSEKRAL